MPYSSTQPFGQGDYNSIPKQLWNLQSKYRSFTMASLDKKDIIFTQNIYFLTIHFPLVTIEQKSELIFSSPNNDLILLINLKPFLVIPLNSPSHLILTIVSKVWQFHLFGDQPTNTFDWAQSFDCWTSYWSIWKALNPIVGWSTKDFEGGCPSSYVNVQDPPWSMITLMKTLIEHDWLQIDLANILPNT